MDVAIHLALGLCFLLVASVSPFWRKMQISTLWVGKAISPTGAEQEFPRGAQDAVTPRFQDRLNLAMPIAWLFILAVGTYVHWYLGMALVALAFVASAALNRLYPQYVDAYLRLIIGDLTRRMADYKRDGDIMRADAASALLQKLWELHEAVRGQHILVPDMPEVKRMPLGLQ